MPTYAGINGVVRKLKEWPVGIDGVVHQQKEVWAGVNGVNRKIYSSGVPITNFPVGSKIGLTESGKKVDFIIVHKGIPGTDYDSSCNGVWVLRDQLLDNQQLASVFFADSYHYTYLQNTYYNMLGADIRSAIKNVKIPYVAKIYGNVYYQIKSSGLQCTCFSLSGTEMGVTNEGGYSFFPVGKKLDYFISGNLSSESKEKRKAKDYSGLYYYTYATRDPYPSYSTDPTEICVIAETGYAYASQYQSGYRYAIRPAFILDENFLV